MIVIRGTLVSPFTRKVHVLCREKGIPFQSAFLAPMPKTPELLAMHPLGKIPVLEEAGRFLPDSSVICAYLERLHPNPALYPADAKEFAQALFLEEYSDTRALEAFAPALVERVIMPRDFDRPGDEGRVVRTGAEIVPPVFDWLEAHANERGLVGGRFSIADCAIGAQLQSWAFAGESVDGRRWPRLRGYSDAMLSRPSFVETAAAFAAEEVP
ncbi:MAG: glutathione S-transferase family protein [Deltaproteobacteria bacterium]|nr:glutathione S-transferase family protein [Deltaproteobacteria bacterium]